MRTLRAHVLVNLLAALVVPLVAGIQAGLRGSAGDGLMVGAVLGVLSITLTVCLLIGDVFGDEGRRPGDRYGPRQELTLPVRAGADLPVRIQAAMRSLKAKVRHADVAAGRYTARTRLSWWSYGEHVTVELTGDPSAPIAHISSRPVVPWALLDIGKGRQNVHQMAAALQA